MARKLTEVREVLTSLDNDKVAFVKKAYDNYIEEAARIDDDLNFIGHPEQCKLDWMIEAITEEIMSEVEFVTIFRLVNLVEALEIAC